MEPAGSGRQPSPIAPLPPQPPLTLPSPLEGERASPRREGGILRAFSVASVSPWLPLIVHGCSLAAALAADAASSVASRREVSARTAHQPIQIGDRRMAGTVALQRIELIARLVPTLEPAEQADQLHAGGVIEGGDE